MSKAMVTGSFDPITMGHVDVVERALARYDEVCVAMLVNPDKTYRFSWDTRLNMLKTVFEPMGVAVYASEGLAVDLAKSVGADVMVRGVREGDEDYERELAKLNEEIGGVPTEFVSASKQYEHLSSSVVREMLDRGEDLTGLVPSSIIQSLKEV